MEKIEIIKNSVIEEIKHHENVIEHFKEILNLLNADILKGESTTSIQHQATRRITRSYTDEIPSSYPKGAFTAKKVRFILSEQNRALSVEEIKEIIKEYEGIKSGKTIAGLNGSLANLFQREKLVKFTFKKSSILFFMLPNGKDAEGKVLQAYLPAAEIVKDLTPEEVNCENITIQKISSYK